MKRLVRCEEWSKLRIGRGLELDTLADVSSILSAWKRNTGGDPSIYFDIRPDSLIPKFWSGTLDTPNLILEVSPIGSLGIGDAMRSRLDANISAMLASAGSPYSIGAGVASLSGDGSRHDALLAVFCRDLQLARRRQIVRRYASLRDSLISPKGRIAFPAQCYESIRRPGKFASEWVALTEDIPENRLLKEVLIRYRPRCSASIRGIIDSCLAELDGVSRPDDCRLEWTRTRTDRLSPQYLSLLEQARSLLDDGGAGVFAGNVFATAEIIFTYRLFEQFVCNVMAGIAPKLALRSVPQKRGIFLCSRQGDVDSFELIPDVLLIDSRDRIRFIVDAKWKALSADKKNLGIAREDIYQLVAYAAKLDCRNLFLVYPDVSVASGEVGFYERFTSELVGGKYLLHVVKLPLLAPTLQTARHFLEGILGKCGEQERGLGSPVAALAD